MFQTFYTDTLGARFIKSLLAQTPVPVFPCVFDGDTVVKDKYYIYGRNIVRCVNSGIINDGKITVDVVPENNDSTITEKEAFEVIRSALRYHRQYFQTYQSTTNYYDPETHYHLGRYLRYLYSTTGLNLLPYYNCYNSTILPDVKLTLNYIPPKVGENKTPTDDILAQKVFVNRTYYPTDKVVAIPIEFGKNYSIHIDCPSQVLYRASLYDTYGFIDEEFSDPSEQFSNSISEGVKAVLRKSGNSVPAMSFRTPIHFRIDPPKDETAVSITKIERNLKLLIQLPVTHDSSIVVLENVEENSTIRCDTNSVRVVDSGNARPSLVYMNSATSYAFSDRLIEYLLGNVIHKNELISNNIEKVQNCFRTTPNKNEAYDNKFLSGTYTSGVWDKGLRNLVYTAVENDLKFRNMYDIDGYVNKDVEQLFLKKGWKY